MRKIYVDGSGWDGKESKVCVVIRDEFDEFNKEVHIIRYEAKHTCNTMEYYALIEGLKFANEGDIILTDSELVIGQVFRGWRANYKHLENLRDIVRAILTVKDVVIQYVPREENLAGRILE